MKINKEKLGEFIANIHNMESVVEVYYDKKKNMINELKCLNYNRYKVYHYALADYSENIHKYNLVIPGV
ncbi:hypothetical protein DNU06_15290 [Putridiphycobacter roseus]|uniref:Uncharacterized protein n=1 Tax=Putridiphycobacter roseus TaxID=2219161 RepID=A0A2W1MXV6_9FLAO|nr:hypothetical protein [Putridiphycobacter roseus]PZE16010.1 hypothetical protein DNU06_15290 [Putridiphycobacter roseus]